MLDGYAAALRGRGLVVDAGCGPAAQIGQYLADRGVAITGLDLSTGAIAEARRRQPGMPLVVADLRALPYARAGVAGLVAFYSAIHLPRPQLVPAFGEFARVLAADGMLLLAMHGGTGEVGADGWLGADVSVRATLVELPELVRLLDAAGLDVIEQHERQPYPDEYPSPRLYVVARQC